MESAYEIRNYSINQRVKIRNYSEMDRNLCTGSVKWKTEKGTPLLDALPRKGYICSKLQPYGSSCPDTSCLRPG